MLKADNLTTFMCQLSRRLGASTSCSLQGLSRPVMGLLYLLPLCVNSCFYNLKKGTKIKITYTPRFTQIKSYTIPPKKGKGNSNNNFFLKACRIFFAEMKAQ